MNNIEKILSCAKGEIGISESPSNSNRVKYNTWYYNREVYGNNYSWCCVFVNWVFDQCGLSEYYYGGKQCASCTTLMNYYKTQNKIVTKDFKAGDLIFYQFDKDAYADHIGILDHIENDILYVIEGNTSLTSDDNGGAVMMRARNKNLVMCAARVFKDEIKDTKPKYEITIKFDLLKNGSKLPMVKLLQALLNVYGNNLTIDGIFGKDTLKAVKQFQTIYGLEVDGEVGKNTWNKLLEGVV